MGPLTRRDNSGKSSIMAECIRLTCSACKFSVDVWDEGNPYYRAADGKKVYVYHPSSDREKATGVDSPHTCLDCGHSFEIDSEAPLERCPKCGSAAFCHDWDLPGHNCPHCRRGTFEIDPGFHMIS